MPSDDEQGKPTKSDKPFFGRMLATVSAVFSILATGVGAFGAWTADQAKQEAEATRLALDNTKVLKEYQIKVFEMVDKSITGDGGLVLASAYAASLDDARLQASLTEAIRVVARSRQSANLLTLEEAEALQLLTQAARNTASAEAQSAPSATAQTQSAAAILTPDSEVGVTERRANKGAINPIGWDIDVFWCASRGEPSQRLAAAIAADLAARADQRQTLAGQQLGRIRVRKLSDEAARRGNLPLETNEVRMDKGEEALAQALGSAAATRANATFAIKTSGAGTKWYLSLFACGTSSAA